MVNVERKLKLMPVAVRKERARKILREKIGGGNVSLFAIDLLSTAALTLSRWVELEVGRESMGRMVPGRPVEEDVEIGLDRYAETFTVKNTRVLAEQHGLSFTVLSEHNNFPNLGVTEGPQLTLVLDPIDNSDEYERGLPTPPFFCFQIYNPANEPLAAGASNLSTSRMYLAVDGNNWRFDLGPEKLVKMSAPREVRSIKDGKIAIASYDGKWKYISLFDKNFSAFKKDLSEHGGSFHGKGGSHIYPDLATGAISAYIMFDEPRGEIDPAFLFAILAGCRVVSVNLEDRTYEDYRFDPEKQYERVPLLVAARSTDFIEEIIEYLPREIGNEASSS